VSDIHSRTASHGRIVAQQLHQLSTKATFSPAWVAISEGRRDGVRAVDAVGVDGALLVSSIDARPQ